jgi:3,4-dihydroxy 2-butanone 4-phosphate synthase / GTP cyclohydrolase II
MRATNTAAGLSSVADTVAALRRGEMVVVVDSPDRENEGDLVAAAEFATPETVNFMANHGRGLICAPMLRERLDELHIPPMVAGGSDPLGTAFHAGVDHVRGTTGISASDRALAIRALADPTSAPADFRVPGHVFPLAYHPGGVLQRAGHTEASIDLMRMAGLAPAAVICEIVRDNGEMARLPELIRFAREHDLRVMAISDLIAHQRKHVQLVERMSEAVVPLDVGQFRAVVYRDLVEGHEHLALVHGEVDPASSVLVRMHSECLTGDVFGSRRCDCGRQLDLALRMIVSEGSGVVVYLRGHEGRGIGLAEKVRAYAVQDSEGLDTVDANLRLGHPVDSRDYGFGMQILRDLGISQVRLLSNNPAKSSGLEGYGLVVSDRVPLVPVSTPESERYVRAKASRMGHYLTQIVS